MIMIKKLEGYVGLRQAIVPFCSMLHGTRGRAAVTLQVSKTVRVPAHTQPASRLHVRYGTHRQWKLLLGDTRVSLLDAGHVPI
jgi:hypothetical protein